MATLNLGNFAKFAARLVSGKISLKLGFAAGAAADTNITVTGMSPGDAVVGVLEFQPPTAATLGAIIADRASELKITAANTVQLDTTATTGNQLLFVWWHYTK